MCGILFSRSAGAPLLDSVVADALAAMARRGPDHAALHRHGRDTLGHTRLSIIEPSPASHQPLRSVCGRYELVLNGEVYNYRELRRELERDGRRFGTGSDTEVLLEACTTWGFREALGRVRGMFSFALYDDQTRVLRAARDHFGQKPLYYATGPTGFALASEINALLALGWPLVPRVDSYLTYLASRGIIHPAHTFFEGIATLPAGHMLTLDGDTPRVEEYFTPWSLAGPGDEPGEDSALEGLDHHLTQAVERHFVADVPVGLFLSGGLDSSLLYAVAAETGKDAAAFTKLTPDIETIPMSVVPGIVAQHPNDWFVSRERLSYYLPGLVDLIGSSGFPARWGGGPPMNRLCRLARRNGVIVLLSGDCPDEYFAGYREQEESLAAFDGDLERLGELSRCRTDNPFYDAAACGAFEQHQRDVRRRILDEIPHRVDDRDTYLEALLWQDTAVFLPTCGLANSDAYSAMAGVELRNPYLDIDLVGYAARLPTHYKLADVPGPNRNKWLFRRLATAKMGEAVDVPKEGTRNYSVRAADRAYWDVERFSVLDLVGRPDQMPTGKALFRLICLEIFHQLYFGDGAAGIDSLQTTDGRAALGSIDHLTKEPRYGEHR